MFDYIYIGKTNLIISSFTFGGGYVVIPMIRKYYIEDRSYLKEEELLEIAAVAQSVPGAIAVNLVVATAFRIKGIPGAILAMCMSILPAFVLLSLISLSYDAFRSNVWISAALMGMQAAVAAIMVDVVAGMIHGIVKERVLHTTMLIPIAFICVSMFHLHVALVLLGSVGFSLAWYYMTQRRTSCDS